MQPRVTLACVGCNCIIYFPFVQSAYWYSTAFRLVTAFQSAPLQGPPSSTPHSTLSWMGHAKLASKPNFAQPGSRLRARSRQLRQRVEPHPERFNACMPALASCHPKIVIYLVRLDDDRFFLCILRLAYTLFLSAYGHRRITPFWGRINTLRQ
jgi:hypothetical protein